MDKVLNQEEIDAMVRAARSGGGDSGGPEQPKVELWDAHRVGQIGREQLQAITLLHEGFARNLTNALGAFLRVGFTAALVSAENLTFREFLQRVPETTYLASCKLDPIGVSGALQLDLKVALPIIDLLLGGQGKTMAATRDVTEIEENILESVARIMCRELGKAWQAISLEVGFDERLEVSLAQRLMPPEEKILSLSFEIIMPDVRGGLNFAVPAAVSNALLRKISASWRYRRPRGQTESKLRLRRRLLECPFPVELGASGARVAISELSELAPGKLLSFRRRSAEPASLMIMGLEMFRALPARCGNSRAARLLDRLPELVDPLAKIPETSTS